MQRLAIFTLLIATTGATAQTPEQAKATVAFIQSLQQADGGFLPAGPAKGSDALPSSLRATLAGVRASTISAANSSSATRFSSSSPVASMKKRAVMPIRLAVPRKC